MAKFPDDWVLVRRKDAEQLVRFGLSNAGNGMRAGVKQAAIRVSDQVCVETPVFASGWVDAQRYRALRKRHPNKLYRMLTGQTFLGSATDPVQIDEIVDSLVREFIEQ